MNLAQEFYPAPKPVVTPKKEPKRLKFRNVKRHKAEWARAYGSVQRVRFVESLPCAACGLTGFSVNAHTRSGGRGRKADAKHIVPLCGKRWILSENHHDELHRIGIRSFERKYQLNLEELATETERCWVERAG